VIELLVRWRHFATAASAIGRRTLPIFVLQLPLIWVLFLLPPVAWSMEFAPVRYLAPMLGTALIVFAALGIQRLLKRGRARGLFELPERWREPVLRDAVRRR
jgi:hypothetical protein